MLQARALSGLLAVSSLVLAALAGCGSEGDGTSPRGEGGEGGATSGTGSAGEGGNDTPSGGVGGSDTTTSGGAGASGPVSDDEPAEMNGMLAAHNAARAGVSPPASTPIPALAWSGEVAAVATAHAERCVWGHSSSPYGENIYATSGTATPTQVANSWISEKNNYDYGNNTCSGVCGHYTQVVWADSRRLGCGVATCTTGSPLGGGSWQYWVCNYDPPGNFNGQRPY
ncbi:CAP domain-containing protein [Chondromyces crocatus]|uniref:SCP domain-containing protein n=1 Tax=Chondromyces crocatus TaxID=52 RepID=A0A0K1ENZ3_CHOCO|nr:CAP domain-containing protein [Chondromyces crocatus]AKT42544.1 uncharacterized protein CMC5_067710 [Chondromyces crocatus]